MRGNMATECLPARFRDAAIPASSCHLARRICESVLACQRRQSARVEHGTLHRTPHARLRTVPRSRIAPSFWTGRDFAGFVKFLGGANPDLQRIQNAATSSAQNSGSAKIEGSARAPRASCATVSANYGRVASFLRAVRQVTACGADGY